MTPDLNKANRYLRGGDDSYSSQIQEDAVQVNILQGRSRYELGLGWFCKIKIGV